MNCERNSRDGTTRRDALELLGGLVVAVAMVPDNPVVGGTVLRRAAVQSPNFVTGSTGWIIRQDGSAEFNNIVIRNGQIVSGQALYYSSSPPALGNLIASIAATAGTDVPGNAFVAGITSYTGGTQAASLANGEIVLWTAPGPGGPWTIKATMIFSAALAIATAVGSGAPINLIADTGQSVNVPSNKFNANVGAAVTGGLTADTEAISASIASGVVLDVTNALSSSGANIRCTVAGVNNNILSFRVAGDTQSRLIFDTDGIGNPRFNLGPGNVAQNAFIKWNGADSIACSHLPYLATAGGTGETDQTPTFANSWAQAAGRVATAYRRTVIPDTMEWAGSLTVPAGFAANQNVTTANPAAYQPTHTQSITGWCTQTNLPVRLAYLNSGILQFTGPVANTASGDTIDIPCQQIRLTL